jgi:acyl dehydratase
MPPLVRTLDSVRIIAYAGATWDWHRLHHDSAYADERGLPAPVIDGQMLGALIAEALLDWLGPRAFLRKLNFRLRSMVFANDTVRCVGQVSSIASAEGRGEVAVAHQVRVDDRLVADGSSLVILPA